MASIQCVCCRNKITSNYEVEFCPICLQPLDWHTNVSYDVSNHNVDPNQYGRIDDAGDDNSHDIT